MYMIVLCYSLNYLVNILFLYIRIVLIIMTYVVTDSCIRCKYTDCVIVCPVDCFKEGENMLIIDPDECIDCGVCEAECPVNAIKPESKDNEIMKWLEINRKYAKEWPRITKVKEKFFDADKHSEEVGKYDKYFKENIKKD